MDVSRGKVDLLLHKRLNARGGRSRRALLWADPHQARAGDCLVVRLLNHLRLANAVRGGDLGSATAHPSVGLVLLLLLLGGEDLTHLTVVTLLDALPLLGMDTRVPKEVPLVGIVRFLVPNNRVDDRHKNSAAETRSRRIRAVVAQRGVVFCYAVIVRATTAVGKVSTGGAASEYEPENEHDATLDDRRTQGVDAKVRIEFGVVFLEVVQIREVLANVRCLHVVRQSSD
mmetsp:Transcript_5466/g.12445  ORF Transcript_5466/g.12445 Transcript_5466/m.12445 type:complete len:229 (-) Transcript_5466:1675-2361(-)